MSKPIEVVGLKDVEKVLKNMIENHAYNLLRATVNEASAEVRKLARKEAPKDSGVLRKSIKNRRLKSPRNKPAAEVYTDKPGFYWHFVNYGTKNGIKANPFRDRAVSKFNANKETFLVNAFKKKLAQKVKRDQKRIKKRG